MRFSPLRTAAVLAAVAAFALPAAPASASSWTPAPTAPFDSAAGERCDAPFHAEPIVDEVVQHVIKRHADGSPSLVAFKGALIIRVTNTDTGASYDADVSGHARVSFHTDGSQHWDASGPVLLGVRAGQGNLPRGVYVVDGRYTLDISPDNFRTVTFIHGSADNVCDHIE